MIANVKEIFNWSVMYSFLSIAESKKPKALISFVLAVIAAEPVMRGVGIEVISPLPTYTYTLLSITLMSFVVGYFICLVRCPPEIKQYRTLAQYFKDHEALLKDSIVEKRKAYKMALLEKSSEISSVQGTSLPPDFIDKFIKAHEKAYFETYGHISSSSLAKEKWEELKISPEKPLILASICLSVTTILAVFIPFMVLFA